ncbi:hypothetical protein M9458_025202, partial [Cirrhinus mrigala]
PALIHSGSSGNFISQDLLSCLHLSRSGTPGKTAGSWAGEIQSSTAETQDT